MESRLLQAGTVEQKTLLAQLGLSQETFMEIGTRILTGFNQATPHDAANAAGTYAYLASVRALRDVLCPIGWEVYRKHNVEMAASPKKDMLIVTSSGDKNTGLNGQIPPKTRNQKGPQVREIVANNHNQGYLWPEMEPPREETIPDSTPTWFLLYHVDLKKNEMRLELSLPVHMDLENLRVDRWSRRIALSSIGFDPRPTEPNDDLGPEFDIEIRRKTK